MHKKPPRVNAAAGQRQQLFIYVLLSLSFTKFLSSFLMPHMPSQQQDFSPRADTAQSKLPAELVAACAQGERQGLQFPSLGAADGKDLSLSCLKAFCSSGLANQGWCVDLQGVLEKRTRLVYS